MTVFSGISQWIRKMQCLFARGVNRNFIIANGQTLHLNLGRRACLNLQFVVKEGDTDVIKLV